MNNAEQAQLAFSMMSKAVWLYKLGSKEQDKLIIELIRDREDLMFDIAGVSVDQGLLDRALALGVRAKQIIDGSNPPVV